MTTGIIPSSMQGKGGKRLNRNNSSIKSNSLIKMEPHGLSPWGSIFGILQASGWGRQCYSRKVSAPVGVFFSRFRIRITCKILENVTQLLTCEVGIFFYG